MSYRLSKSAEAGDTAALSRRDFLKLRVRDGRRVLELSCESLYMRYQDARSGAGIRQVSNHDDAPDPGGPGLGLQMLQPDALFAELEQQLADVDELRILESEWLNDAGFGRDVAARIDAFRQRGGRVELGDNPNVAQPTAGAARA